MAGRDATPNRPVTQHSRDTPQFYLTAPSPCPYLGGKEERKVFTHLVGERAGEDNILTHDDFRQGRSMRHPAAPRAVAPASRCASSLDDFPRTNHGMRRMGRAGGGIAARCASPCQRPAIECPAPISIHGPRDSGMAEGMTVFDYAMMVEDSHVETRIVEYGESLNSNFQHQQAPAISSHRTDNAQPGCPWSLVSSLTAARSLAR